MRSKPGKLHTRHPDEEVPLPGELDCRAYHRRAARVTASLVRSGPGQARRRVRDMTTINPDFAALVMWIITRLPTE